MAVVDAVHAHAYDQMVYFDEEIERCRAAEGCRPSRARQARTPARTYRISDKEDGSSAIALKLVDHREIYTSRTLLLPTCCHAWWYGFGRTLEAIPPPNGATTGSRWSPAAWTPAGQLLKVEVNPKTPMPIPAIGTKTWWLSASTATECGSLVVGPVGALVTQNGDKESECCS